MKKLLGIVVLGLLLSTSAYTDDIKDFQIERISIGDSALDYFSEAQLEDNGFPSDGVAEWDAPCITKGAKIGGDKGGQFRGSFLKFFKKNLL